MADCPFREQRTASGGSLCGGTLSNAEVQVALIIVASGKWRAISSPTYRFVDQDKEEGSNKYL